MNSFHHVKLDLPLKKTFSVSGGSTSVKTNLLAVMNNRYIGEAATSVKSGPTITDLQSDLETGFERLAKVDEPTVETVAMISQWTDIHPIARSALTGMLVHYLSGESKRYPWELLSLYTPVGITTSMTIGLDTAKEMIEAITTSQYPVLKIKLGEDRDRDKQVITALEAIQGKEFRIDANGGWTPAEAEENIYYLNKIGVSIIEQPTKLANVVDWPHLKGKSEEVHLIADEGVNSVEDFEKVKEHVDGVNVKMEKAGGIVDSVALAKAVRDAEKKVMLGCMVESSFGIAPSIYMSSLADYCDLDGPQLLEEDIAFGISNDHGEITVDREIIGGPRLKRDVVEKYIATD